ncbi:MAG: hypothetical protein IIY89_02815, partial [Clostridia bacterium]|nr:hypothetical protein [Clostridia bacterium]
MPKQVPVYLFTGFLESGKTKFAQETLQDSTFNNGDRMLLLVCEEGIEEYAPDEFAAPNIFMEVIEDESELTTENLAALLKKHRASYVIVEYNGMWMLDSLYSSMPPEWVVAQEFMFVDSTTFLNYNNNMRQLMVDKLQSCELVVFNRFPEGDEDLKMQAHVIVRATNRRCDIAFDAYQSIVRSNNRTIIAYDNFILQNISMISTPIENKGNLSASNVIFSNNNRAYGGAFYSLSNDQNIYLRNCSFYNNSAQYGGAIFLRGANAEIIDCEFINNSATLLYGGAICSESVLDAGTNLTIRNTKFINDKSIGDAGGALY